MTNQKNNIEAKVRAELSGLSRLVKDLPGGTEACDAIQESLGSLLAENERLYKALDEEMARRAHAQDFRQFIYEDSPFSMSIATLADGRFFDVNEAFIMRTGYAREEIIGHTSAEIGLWADGENRQRIVDALRQDGEINGLEIRVRKKGGEVIHGLFYARLITLNGERCILSITQNIEERRRAELEAIRLREFYEELLALLPAHIAMVDSSCRYEYASPSAVPDPETRSWIIGQTMEEYCEYRGINPEIGKQRTEWVNLVVARKEVMQFDERFPLESGDVEHWIRTHKPILDENGNVTHVLIYGLDVTDLRKLEDQFRQAQKMEAVGRLAGGVAHDFNNLLTAIMGTADLMAGQPGDTQAVQSGAEEILGIAERGAALTRQLLTFSRRQVASRRVVNLNQIIKNMHELLRRLIGENIRLDVQLASSLPDIYADISQIEQVLLNLVVNARDAMPRGGAITVRTRVDRPRLRKALQEAPDGSFVHLSVSDTGMGMDPEVLARIFEPFFTTKEEGQGTGLGLSTVYAIVRSCDGKIVAESTPGQGSVFTIAMPVAEHTEEDADSPAPRDRRTDAEGTVLVVEDEESVRKVVERILQKEGYTVLAAPNAREALRILQRQGTAIDLVLTDMVMPGPSGRDLAESILETWPNMRILFMSGHIENRDSRFIAEQLGDRFIQKPFTADVLTERVSNVLNGL
ncbi:MAG: hypothetical protein AMXMBFR82_28680 [Candidatus Hydrogenedentota bacterium]